MKTERPQAEITLTPTEKDFIQSHLTIDINELILKAHTFPHLNIRKLGQQILARQKAKKKLPEWYANDSLVFPPALSIEQASSEAAARFKASLMSGSTLLDITGGTGIDHFYMSQGFDRSYYCEINPEVSQVAAHNFNVLMATQTTVFHGDFLTFVKEFSEPVDWIYADPARRGTQKEKVVRLTDCTPDILAHLPVLFAQAPNILLKTSPLLDITGAVKALGCVSEVYAIGLGNECKELLFVLRRDTLQQDPIRKVRLLDQEGKAMASLDFNMHDEQQALIAYKDPQRYLYEPHAALLKGGAFRMLGPKFEVGKLAPSSHLYTSESLAEGFPGRSFEILEVCKPDAKELKKHLPTGQANVTIRNFPGTVNDLRKKLRLKEGGDTYLFATTLSNHKKVVLVTKKC
ncbi:RNA cap guanine-N2 methyltransferase [Dyadobacter jejuensis]|uniref:RNA cap guanine-N2 methyltransferase n=1 Tax=Dyadobacter jejuensis TaxID=1082580 RepID=A0A316B6M9_9BACT|nr:class I SAM-dependent methyltransferase [Dyadobacter jejuensis]PWJ58197.1 RNA cap guanine-N2 methyltransferase [Dyadobacter jejuensis]